MKRDETSDKAGILLTLQAASCRAQPSWSIAECLLFCGRSAATCWHGGANAATRERNSYSYNGMTLKHAHLLKWLSRSLDPIRNLLQNLEIDVQRCYLI
ncbi:hypothetical protein ATANTOWER_025564 [Ataeniobius toweri]|uniref:Uncharacterized protein n=1 Tax=Ataeniobius toweri TaxID=208326 RepID=A0ABU7C2K0_9TELE|nr:hypothetical protein [Ataeniobius toweri]